MSQEHAKHLQLGTDLSRDDRSEVSEEDRDLLWEDATTVEVFKEELEALQDEPFEVQWVLAEARNASGPPPPLEGD